MRFSSALQSHRDTRFERLPCHHSDSEYGTVLGHIFPRSGRQQPGEIHGGENHTAEQMQRLKTVYQGFKAGILPQSESGTHTIHAMLNGEITLRDQKQLIERNLLEMGLPSPTSFSYNVGLHAHANVDTSKRTVLLLGNSLPPMLLVEDSVVLHQAQTQAVTRARQTSQAIGSSPGPGLSATTSFTGWAYSNQSYMAYRDGAIVETSSFPPLKQWAYSTLGWGNITKKWIS